MTIQLKLTKESDPQWHREYLFTKDIVTIGRGLDNDLQLLEGLESGVSRQHAKIEKTDGPFILIDLSRNSSFLNKRQLQKGEAHALEDGDQIKIGEFNIVFSARVDKNEEDAASPQTLEERNLFWRETKELALILDRLSQKYESTDSPSKDAALEEALKKAFSDLESSRSLEVVRFVINSYFSFGKSLPTRQVLDLAPQAESQGSSSFIDIFLSFLTKSKQAYKEFRINFVGDTLIESPKHGSLGDCSCDELKDFLFDPSISTAELEKRLKSVQALADEVMLHQLALLEGYKASIVEGTKHILSRMNPKRCAEKKIKLGVVAIPVRFIPIVNYINLFRSWKGSYNELSSEDQSIIEKKYFRSAYVRSYNKRMDLSRKRNV